MNNTDSGTKGDITGRPLRTNELIGTEIPLDKVGEVSAEANDVQPLNEVMDVPRRGYSRRPSALIVGIWSIWQSIRKIVRKVPLFDFLIELIEYLSLRLRVVFVLSSVLSEVLSRQFEFVKTYIVRKMFWGRGNLYKLSIQMAAVLLVLVTVMLGSYRSRLTEAATNEMYVARSSGYSEDLLVQNSTTTTQVSDQSVRYEPEIYIVKGGDNLIKIAQYYNISVDTLLWANDMTEFDVLQTGLKLKIPPGDGLYVTVESGDTVESLAQEYKTHEQLIVQFNFLPAPFTLDNGQKLFLPGGQKERPAPPKRDAPIFTGVISTPTTGGTGTKRFTDPTIGRFLAWPVAGGKLSQCYSGYHNGVDIADKSSPNVIAAAPGVVTLAGCQSGNCPRGEVGGRGLAWTVIVDHGNGYSTVYGHLSTGDIYVSNGQAVSRGQALGKMGQSGLAYGIHLHFMLIKSGTWQWVNPSQYMMTHICGY